jgi:hypothetical protein
LIYFAHPRYPFGCCFPPLDWCQARIISGARRSWESVGALLWLRNLFRLYLEERRIILRIYFSVYRVSEHPLSEFKPFSDYFFVQAYTGPSIFQPRDQWDIGFGRYAKHEYYLPKILRKYGYIIARTYPDGWILPPSKLVSSVRRSSIGRLA